MSVVAVPNVSVGSNEKLVADLAEAVAACGALVLDTHSDAVHERTVFTVAGSTESLVEAMTALAIESKRLDLTEQQGVHPRTGVLDVCPYVPHGESMQIAVDAARRTGTLIAERAGLPVYLYGEAALRPGTRVLPDLRRGGLEALRRRSTLGLPPDFGDAEVTRAWGAVCVGARHVLIAFNVWLDCEPEVARAVAARVRESGGGLTGVRALGLVIDPPRTCQVSMNLTKPTATGIDVAFEAVAAAARAQDASILATEIVGLPPRRFLPSPDAQATRLLQEPSRSLESALAAAGL
ncbi:MAG: glutamate formimidoyltransferase [Actinomycetota bacterium]